MTMTPEELLRPRYKVIADYPNCSYEVGRVVTPDSSLWINSDEITLCSPDVDKYPHLFKPLEWWEERSVDDMPQYISYISLTKKDRIYGNVEKSEDNFCEARVFIKIETWDINKDDQWIFNDNIFSPVGHPYLPATESEYLSQQKHS